jgi:hypothetical protein
VIVVRLLRFFIQKQLDNTFAIIARIEHDGMKKDVVLHKGQTSRDLQRAFITYTNDQESLQVDILASLQQEKQEVLEECAV